MLEKINDWDAYTKAKALYNELINKAESCSINGHYLHSLANAIKEKMTDFVRRLTSN